MKASFCLVLHGHLPWVLHHGRWPHGEDWLFEAAAETWLPLLEILDTCATERIRPAWTVGLTPILLEQLASSRFREGFDAWLAEGVARAQLDAETFGDDGHLVWLANAHAEHWTRLRENFARVEADLVGALRAHADAGRIELLSSNATHAYHPLLLHDASARAQLRAGLATSRRHLSRAPAGIWLPECAYRPEGLWWPPAIHGDPRERAGVASLCDAVGVRFFMVDAHLVEDPLVPVRIVEGRPTGVTALARHPSVSEVVWSGEVGYPGDPAYLEFHKRHGTRGHRYWKVTGRDVDLGGKDRYHPDDVGPVLNRHADHFCELVRAQVQGRSGDPAPVVTAPFDAELFGHWWHEGPRFLLEVVRRLSRDALVVPRTVSEALAENPGVEATLPEGSWGDGGDHRVWLNDELLIYWQVAYRAEDRFLDLWHRAPWREDEEVAGWLGDAARQLLLVQASDWPFVISTGGAVDYGLRRILDHAARFDDLCNGVEDLIARRPVDPIVVDTRRRSQMLDPVFPDLDLSWWE